MKKTLCLFLIMATLTTVGCRSNTSPTSSPTTSSSSCQHDFYTTVQESTCTEDGFEKKTCRLCGYEESMPLTATGHSFMTATCSTPKTCGVCGISQGNALGHRYINGTCVRCGTVPPAPDCKHSYQITQKQEPTCTNSGATTYTCSDCGYFYTESIPATGHRFSDATCLSGKICSLCNATAGEPLGHRYGDDHLCIRCGAADPDQPIVTAEFSLTIRAKGTPVPNVTVTVFVNDSTTAAGSGQTDAKGKVIIPVTIGSSYRVVLSDVPSNYSCKESYSFSSLIANINLSPVAVLDPNDHSKAQYKVGSTMADFTLTDTDGNTYTLSKLLGSKNAVILNFWYVSCTPCKAEFPYFEEYYQQFSDDIQFLALDHLDTTKEIQDLRDQMGVTFPMIREDIGMRQGFNLSAYPTTVVIGKDMKILLIHEGTYSQAEVLKLFQTYAS